MATAGFNSNTIAKAPSVTTTITVKAAPGVRVPMEGAPRKYITDSAPVTVTRTAYYIRRLKDKDLILTDAQGVTQAAKTLTTDPVRARGVGSEA